MSSSNVTPGSVGSMVNGRRRSEIMSQGQLEQLQELDDIKVKTMFQMVEDVKISTGGLSISKKFLYLTNKQAASFNATNMENVLQALELQESHFVIRLVPSLNGMAEFYSHKERRGTLSEKLNHSPTLNQDDLNRTESQLILFIKQCILPVAMQTRALILCGGADDCSISMAVKKVMGPVMERMGKECPFTIIGMVYAPEIHAKAHEGSKTVAGQYAAQSKTWSRRFSDLHDCMVAIQGEDMSKLQQCDMNSACTHMIVFETLDMVKQCWNATARKSFENTFIECMTRKLPSIVIQAQRCDGGIQQLGDIVRRNIPLLLLDSRERWPLITPEENSLNCRNPVTALAKELGSLEPPVELKEETFDKTAVAKRLLTEHCNALRESGTEGGVAENWDASTLAFFRGLCDYTLHQQRRSDKPQRRMSLHSAIEAESEATSGSSSFAGLDRDTMEDMDEKKLTNLYFELMGALKMKAKLKQTEAYIKSRDPTWSTAGDGGGGDDDGGFNLDGEESADGASLFQLKDPEVERAKQYLKMFKDAATKIDKNGGRHLDTNLDSWAAVYDILTSKNCFAESLFDLSGIASIMSNVAKIDNLPDKHSKEALSLIQHAWCLIDLYHSVSDRYKWTTKICYILMLLMSVAVVGVGLVMNSTKPIALDRITGNYIILGLSLANTIIAGLTSFMNPATRWHLLRSSALQIESEIWWFRTRTGKYRDARSSTSRTAEKKFHKALNEIEHATLQSGDLQLTTFYSKGKIKWSKHGQFDRSNCCWAGRCCRASKESVVPLDQIDNHHSPLRPNEYLNFRLQPMQQFYIRRLPGYSRSRSITKMVTVLGSISSSILTVIDMAQYSVLLVVIISCVVAWSEFSGTEKKLERYSTVVNGLGQVDLWWNSLPEVERLASKSIDQLVSTVESHIRSERQGWRAISQTAKKLSQATDAAQQEGKLPPAVGENSISSPSLTSSLSVR
jgi:hypothetical protein